MEAALKEYRKAIDRADVSDVRTAEAEYKLLKARHQKYKRRYTRLLREYSSSKKEYEKVRSEFNIQSSFAVLRKNFKVILKDDTEITARLISVSDKSDLALLKIEQYRTPFIQYADGESIRQGMRVFAIGSPLGITDVLTVGIVAGLKEEYVITDAKILPGSSGGPLVNEAGKAVGINSLKVSEHIGGEGFGVAISIGTALKEFSKYIQRK